MYRFEQGRKSNHKDNNDSIREIMSGEVSIRGVKGYV